MNTPFGRRTSRPPGLSRAGGPVGGALPTPRAVPVFVDEARSRRFLRQAVDAVGIEALFDTSRLRWFARAADPDAAALRVLRVAESQAAGGRRDRVAELCDADPEFLGRLVAVVGASEAVCEHLERNPSSLDLLAVAPEADHLLLGTPDAAPASLRENLLRAVGADPDSAAPVASLTGGSGVQTLRRAYRDLLLRVTADDVLHSEPTAVVGDVTAALSDMAAAVLDAGLAVARAEVADAGTVRLAVIGMGKCGARELNYVSDVDVVYCWAPVSGDPTPEGEAVATRLASRLAETVSAVGADPAVTEPALWELDAALRPEGKAGALVRRLDEFENYYASIAENWEFQALLKARPIAGDAALGDAWREALHPLVWRASERPGFIAQVRAMRLRVVDLIPSKDAHRQIKLGPGGLRDVEFSAQLLQLVHGHDDPAIRRTTTLVALDDLGARGYIGTRDRAELDAAYRFLRVVEHRLQIPRMQRTALLPVQDEKLRVLARSVYPSGDRSAARLLADRERHAIRVRALHEQIFYRPILDVAAGHEYGGLRPESARERLAAFGYRDPATALGHIAALTSGVSRATNVQRQVLPAMLDWFSSGVDPDAGLLSFRRLSDSLSGSGWYVRMLRDSGNAARSLARILSLSHFASDLLLHNPASTAWLDDPSLLQPRSDASLDREVESLLTRHGASAVEPLRAMYTREVLRTAMGEILGIVERGETPALLSRAMDRTIAGALRAVRVGLDGRADVPAYEFAIVAMGRLGGAEIGYFSDADVMYVYRAHDPDLPAEQRSRLASHVRTVAMTLAAELGRAGVSLGIELDADLRPEGKNGPLVRTFEGYRGYYTRWSEPWEAQALLRARLIAGYQPLVKDFLALVDPLRYPAEVPEASVRQMRTLKARMENERLPRGADPRLHLKLGRGGLSDVEWCAQLLQLRHAHAHPALRTTSTLEALTVAAELGLLASDDAEILTEAWTLATRVRAAVMLHRGRTAESLPADMGELEATARLMGYPAGNGGTLREDYLGATRRARKVMERVFYGLE